MPPHAKPGLWRYQPRLADRLGRHRVQVQRGAGDLLQAPRHPGLLGGRLHSGITQRDGEELALVLVDPGGHQRTVGDVGHRAPVLATVELPPLAGRAGGQPRRRALRGVHPPEQVDLVGRDAPGLVEDGQGVEVRLHDTGDGEVGRTEGGEQLPQQERRAAPGPRRLPTEGAGEVGRAVEVPGHLGRGDRGQAHQGGRRRARAGITGGAQQDGKRLTWHLCHVRPRVCSRVTPPGVRWRGP